VRHADELLFLRHRDGAATTPEEMRAIVERTDVRIIAVRRCSANYDLKRFEVQEMVVRNAVAPLFKESDSRK
jgi:hypothetical protein